MTRLAAAVLLALALAACAVPEWQKPGTPLADIERTMGRPTLVEPLESGGQRLVYSRQPAGQQVYHMDFDAGQRLVRVTQVLTLGALGGVVTLVLELPTSGFADAFGRRAVLVTAAVQTLKPRAAYRWRFELLLKE